MSEDQRSLLIAEAHKLLDEAEECLYFIVSSIKEKNEVKAA